MTDDLCKCGCGRPAHARGYAKPCYARWHRAGFPASGPPRAMSAAESTALGRAAKDRKARDLAEGSAEEDFVPDAADLAWARHVRERIASGPQRRADAMQPIATDLIGCVGRRDAKGIRELLAKVQDWHALAVVLADRAAWVDGERRVIWARRNERRSA